MYSHGVHKSEMRFKYYQAVPFQSAQPFLFPYFSPSPRRLMAEKIALTDALVMLELTPTP